MLTAGRIVTSKVRKGRCKKVAFQLHYEGQNNRADGRSRRGTPSLE